jgi:hypothetical protein
VVRRPFTPGIAGACPVPDTLKSVRKLTLPLLLASIVVATLFASPASATATDQQLRAVRAEIASAKSSLAGWQSWLQGWGDRIDAARQDLRAAESAAEQTRRSLLESDLPRASVVYAAAADVNLQSARERMSAILTSREALTGEQNVVAWQNYIMGLEAERHTILAGAITPPADGSPVSFQTWAKLFLTRLGAPACADNVAAVIAWETQESTSAAYNPLATTHAVDGAALFNSVGVRNYVSLDQGLQATVDTLQLGADTYGYGSIMAALDACAPASTTAAAINASAWCSGCSGGGYLVALLPVVQASLDTYGQRLIGIAQPAA